MKPVRLNVLASLIRVRGDCLKLEDLNCHDCPFGFLKKMNDDYNSCPYRLDPQDENIIMKGNVLKQIKIIVDPVQILAAVYVYMEECGISMEDIFEEVL